jgi:hypothetical protein
MLRLDRGGTSPAGTIKVTAPDPGPPQPFAPAAFRPQGRSVPG